MRIPISLVVALGFLIAPVWASSSKDEARPDPLPAERIEALSRISVVAIRPVRISSIAGSRPDVAEDVAVQLGQQLEAAGFRIVPAATYQDIFDRTNRELGGIYDPINGRLKADTAKVLLQYAEREHRRQHPHEAVLYSGIVEVVAPFSGSYARWHGTEDWTTGKAPMGGIVGFLIPSEPQASGRLPALSLGVSLDSADGQVLYSGMGGIELAAHVGPGIRRRQPEALLRDKDKLRRGLEIALGRFQESAESIRLVRKASAVDPTGADVEDIPVGDAADLAGSMPGDETPEAGIPESLP